jgi:hypothetical protein
VTENKIFQLHFAKGKYPHIFAKGTVPTLFPTCINEYDDAEGDIPCVDLRIQFLIDINILKGKPYENEVREMVGLSTRKVKDTE